MSKSIIIDPGHGGTDSGATAFGVKEKDWNLKISLYQYKRLKELGVNVGITRTTDITLDSVPRTNLIKNKYDYCISNHWNAFNGKARGVETIHSIFANKNFATSIANSLVKVSGLPLRRVFTKKNTAGLDWYFMHRLTGSTHTVIVEYGFLDNKADFDWYSNENNFYKAAEVVIESICKAVGVVYKPVKADVHKPKQKPVEKTISMLADEVERGIHGNGEARKKSLGSKYQAVQNEVNRRYGYVAPKPKPKPKKIPFDTVVRNTYRGNYGNGSERKKNIEALGHDYNSVQKEVNKRYY